MSVINKIFPWLSIRSKLIIAFVGLSIIPLLLVGIYSVLSNVNTMENIAIENLNHDVNTIKEKTANFLENIGSDLRTLGNSPFFEEFLLSLKRSHSNSDKNILKQIGVELLSFSKTKKIYYQLRIIDGDGDELLKIEDQNDSIHQFRITSEENLKHGRETFYFILVRNLLKDQIAFVPAEIASGNDERIPVISFAMPLIIDSFKVGILIANVYAKDFFQVIESRPHLETRGKVLLVREDGNYLYHSEKKKDWNKLLASREIDNLNYDYPANIVSQLISGNEGIITRGINEILSYSPLFPNPGELSDISVSSGFNEKSFVLESVPKEVILGPVRSFAITFIGFLLLFLLTAIGLGLLATQQFTKPILALQRGAEIIAEGNYDHRLEVETHDEIEKLARQFNSMASSLKEHTLEIQQHRTKLEEKVEQRTHELTEEKTKLQAILDNVPSAFVLLDKNFCIQSASAAFTSVTGYALSDVRGQNCNTILCQNGFCQNCICKKAYQNGSIESHIDKTTDSNGEDHFIEHIAIPIREKEEINSILEIITDVTKRERLKQNIKQAEKLTAVGEMSAIIAHEFRNLLTSVKIILQLQGESSHLTYTEKDSLSVALNSIEHMESIVTDLLNFARPKQMEFKMQSLANLVSESLAIAQLQIDKQKITVKKKLDSSLQTLYLDGNHFKEVLINILINSAQSFDNSSNKSLPKEIAINVKKARIQKTLRDFALVEENDNNDINPIGREIVLKKGTECALIEISDTGYGINRINLKRIFDPFFTTKPNGTGLGLPMVKRIVNAHNGIVTVTSKIHKGSKISIYLPLISEEVCEN